MNQGEKRNIARGATKGHHDSLWNQIAQFQAENAHEMQEVESFYSTDQEAEVSDSFTETSRREGAAYFVEPHVHEIKAQTRLTRCKHCGHTHRFTGTTGGAILLPDGGHVHGIEGITENPRKT